MRKVTRTITVSRVKYAMLNKQTLEVTTEEMELLGSYKDLASVEKELKTHDTPAFKAVAVLGVSEETVKCSMTEDDFYHMSSKGVPTPSVPVDLEGGIDE